MLARLRLTLTITAALVAAVVVPAQADQVRPQQGDVGPVPGGGAFVIQSCGEPGATTGWTTTLNGNPGALSTGQECPPVRGHLFGAANFFDQTGLWISDRLGNAGGDIEAAFGDRAEMTFTPAPGTSITRLRYWRKVSKYADDNWQPYIALSDRTNIVDTCEVAGAQACQVGADDWGPNDTDYTATRTAYADRQGLSASSIILGLFCRDNGVHVCGNGFSIPHVEVQVYSAFLTIADPSAPTLSTPSGDGWSSDQWLQGTVPLAAASSDNTGISATRVYADGSLIATVQRTCHYTQPQPCSDEPTGAIGLPTVGLPDGPHSIQVAAVDAAGNETRLSRPAPLNVDNQPPAAPVGLTSPASTSMSNSFTASWVLPADSGSPIVAARYQLCQNGSCGAVQTAPSLTSVSGLVLPAAGPATLRVWLVDQVGHENAAAPATLTLAYTPVVQPPPTCPTPGAVPPQCAIPTPTPDPPCCTVKPPSPAVTKTAAGLRLTTTRRSGRKVTVAGKLSSKASGRVTVRYRVRLHGHTHTVTKTATITHGSFRANLVISKTLAAVRTGTVSVAYKGDKDTKSQTRTATLRVSRR
jgi:hypothetical protein